MTFLQRLAAPGVLYLLLLCIVSACQLAEHQTVSGDCQLTICTDDVLSAHRLFHTTGVEILPFDATRPNSYSVPLNDGAYFYLVQGRDTMELYLAPNYQVTLTFRRDGTVEAEGYGAQATRYLARYEAFIWQQPALSSGDTLQAADLIREIRRRRNTAEAFLDHYQRTHANLSPSFMRSERARILYSWANQLLESDLAHSLITSDDEIIVSDTYHDYFRTASLEESDLLSLPEYQTFVLKFLKNETQQLVQRGDRRPFFDIQWDLTKDLIHDQAVGEFAQFHILSTLLASGEIRASDDRLAVFLKTNHKAAYSLVLRRMIDAEGKLSRPST